MTVAVKRAVKRVVLNADIVESFAGLFLSPMYDNPQPTPDLHRECWGLYCSDAPRAAVAAPREHAKSTALTHDYSLAVSLFREQDFIIIVSNTEKLAVEHLSEIAKVFRDNDEVRQQFGVESLPTDNNTDIIVQFTDGHQCRFLAKGSGQKMRGLKWNGKRPGLIICDDLEDDSEVESKDMRDGFARWFNRALIPCLRRGGKIRMHGTILHEGSLLARLMRSKSWSTKLFKAHKGFDDFSEILWPDHQW